jgi:hypothetical protein
MQKSLLTAAICGLLIATALPAAAANLDQVRGLCAKNQKCKPMPSPAGDKGGDFCVDTAPGGSTCETIVSCPGDRSPCWTIGIMAGQRKARPTVSPETILQDLSQ